MNTNERIRTLMIALFCLAPFCLALVGCGSSGNDADQDEVDDGSTDIEDGPTTTVVAASTSTEPEQCAKPVVEHVAERVELTVDGETRWFLLTSPEGTVKRPLVFDFHGLAEGAQVHTQMTSYGELALAEGFVVATPNGRGEPVAWDISADEANGDLAFFDAMVAMLAESECIDERKIYATGLSNGAMFSSLLVCERSSVIAAATPVDGAMVLGECDQDRPVPIQVHHGTADPILLFNGGIDRSALNPVIGSDADVTIEEEPDFTVVEPGDDPTIELNGPGYPATVEEFANKNGCEAGHTDTDTTDEIIHRTFDCPADATVEFYIVRDGGHAWPGSDFSATIESIVGHTTFDIDATVLGWEFMSQFSLTSS